jgi:hypothetical protein
MSIGFYQLRFILFFYVVEKLVEICEAVAWFGVGRIEKQLI